MFSLVARFTKLISGNRNIINLHGSVFYEYRSYGWKLRSYAYYILEFMMLKLSDMVIVASEELKKFLINAFWNFTSKRSWLRRLRNTNGAE